MIIYININVYTDPVIQAFELTLYVLPSTSAICMHFPSYTHTFFYLSRLHSLHMLYTRFDIDLPVYITSIIHITLKQSDCGSCLRFSLG